jgi:hypothetical protein
VAKLTGSQVKTLAKQAGFPDKELDTAARVAYVESSWNTEAHADDSDDNSYGLWQINMIGSMGAPRRKAFGIDRNERLFEPATNAKAAYIVWKGQGWKGWTSYTSGDYKSERVDRVMGGAVASDDPSLLDGLKDKATSLNPIAGVADSVNAASRNFVKGFVSTGAVLVGIVLLALGILVLVMSTKSGKRAADVAGGTALNVLPGGAALKTSLKGASSKVQTVKAAVKSAPTAATAPVKKAATAPVKKAAPKVETPKVSD